MRLFIQELEDKFINNISLIKHKDIVIVNDDIDNDLYSIHYRYNFDSYVFISSLMTNEIYQYILEFYHTKQIILYHDILNENVISSLANHCINISPLDIQGIIKIPNLINEHIFFNMGKQRQKHIPCFVDNAEMLDENLLNILYPHTKFNIRLFGPPSIKHPQNIGILSEQEKAEILNESESCLLLNDKYIAEALNCGTKILRLKEGLLTEDKTSMPSNTETYAQFLIRILQK
jgi:hypothetical protein